jgi:hypothetical protein
MLPSRQLTPQPPTPTPARRDLLEVCEAQLQFVPPCGWPVCGGSRGPELAKSLADITASFQLLLAGLQRVDYNILDPNVTRRALGAGQGWLAVVHQLRAAASASCGRRGRRGWGSSQASSLPQVARRPQHLQGRRPRPGGHAGQRHQRGLRQHRGAARQGGQGCMAGALAGSGLHATLRLLPLSEGGDLCRLCSHRRCRLETAYFSVRCGEGARTPARAPALTAPLPRCCRWRCWRRCRPWQSARRFGGMCSARPASTMGSSWPRWDEGRGEGL